MRIQFVAFNMLNVRAIEVTSKKDSLKATVSLVPWNSVEKWIELVREHYFSFDFSRALFPVLRSFGFTGDKLTEYNQFPFQEDNINNWFVQEVTSPGKNEMHRVNIMNVDGSGRKRKCYVNQNNIRNFPSDLNNENGGGTDTTFLFPHKFFMKIKFCL